MQAKIKVGANIYIVPLKSDKSLYESMVDYGVIVDSPCGGKGVCKKCRAKVISSDFPIESSVDGYILTCKCFPKGNIEIELENEFDISVEIIKKSNALRDCRLALDLGTTTLVYDLLDQNYELVARVKTLNPQRVYGADVLSRISFCNGQGVDKLQNLTISWTERVIKELKSVIGFVNILDLTVCANTILTHIFAGVPPKKLGEFPFKSAFNHEMVFSGQEFGLSVDKVRLLPTFSAFIGSDVLAGLNYLDFGKKDCELFIDLGTNGEIALYKNGKYYYSSVAVGPAFEGGKIECGMSAKDGAVKSVKLVGGFVDCKTIGNLPMQGICGTGMIDLVSCLLKMGVLDENGKIAERGRGVKEDKFYLSPKVWFSQKDVREFQLAKAAIRTGIELLCQKIDVNLEEIQKVYLAGLIGEHIDIESARDCEIVPCELVDKCQRCGNVAILGVEKLIYNNFCTERLLEYTKNAEYIELSLDSNFQSSFVKNLNF